MVAQHYGRPFVHQVTPEETFYLGRLFTEAELTQLNKLVRDAIFYTPIQKRLIQDRDPAVLYAYNFKPDVRQWILTRPVNTLQEFAQAIQNHQNITGWDIL